MTALAARAAHPQPSATSGSGTVDDFFARVETRQHAAWPAGRPDLHWHLLFDVDTIDRELVTPYRAITHRPGLAPVPARWLHLTLLHGGPIAEYRRGEIDAITELVHRECASIEPLDLTVDRPCVGRVAIECPARPGAPARRLWELTARVDAEVTGHRFPMIPATYYPHLTLAYGTRRELHQAGADRAALKRDLSDHPGQPVTLRATQLSLVAQVHNRQHITWTPMATVPLGTSAG